MVPTSSRETAAPAAADGLGLRELADALDGTPAERGLRERKKRARRLALIDAAQHLVTEHGLDAVTVEMISARAGVSPRTFFNYFESKDDAVLGADDGGLPEDVVGTFVDGGPTGRLLSDVQSLVAALLATADEGTTGSRRPWTSCSRSRVSCTGTWPGWSGTRSRSARSSRPAVPCTRSTPTPSC
nr:hypothetical protein GCM10025730_14230 [Promicromonospora thailandica]